MYFNQDVPDDTLTPTDQLFYYIRDRADDPESRDPDDIPNLDDALKEAIDQFEENPYSDDLGRDKIKDINI